MFEFLAHISLMDRVQRTPGPWIHAWCREGKSDDVTRGARGSPDWNVNGDSLGCAKLVAALREPQGRV